MEKVILKNGWKLPVICVGTNRMDAVKMQSVMRGALEAGIRFFDSARDYGNEPVVGEVLSQLMSHLNIGRSEVFITTKVGNTQQLKGNMAHEIEVSLKNLHTDYVDAWFLHWPYPNLYEENLLQMYKLREQGKARAIGLANPRVRHLQRLVDLGIPLPDVIQIEHHPFRLSQDILDFCILHHIQVEAYSPLCFMIEKIRENEVLENIAVRHNKSLGQIVLRWHYQHHVIPVFRSEKPNRFMENVDIFDFELSGEEMQMINSLDEEYKFIPESLHCPGY